MPGRARAGAGGIVPAATRAGDDYTGHYYIGHDYTGDNKTGHNSAGHDCKGHYSIGHNYTGHNKTGHNYSTLPFASRRGRGRRVIVVWAACNSGVGCL